MLTPRAILPMAASDGIYVAPAVTLPPVDPSYCFPANPSGSPPTRIFGTLTIGGQPAPVNTIVQVTFDGVAGPAAATQAPGGYHVDYNAGAATCSNHAGAAIGIEVNGTPVPTGTAVGDSAEPFLIFNIALP